MDDNADTVTVRVVRLVDALPAHAWAMGRLNLQEAEPPVPDGAELLTEAWKPAVGIPELVDHTLDRFGCFDSEVRVRLPDHGYDTVLYEPITNDLSLHPIRYGHFLLFSLCVLIDVLS